MGNIRLNFGGHSGKLLSECPVGYVWWLSQQGIKRQNASEEAATYLESIKTEDERNIEREERLADEIIDARIEAYEAAHRLAWTSKTGHQIIVKHIEDDEFVVSVNGYESRAIGLVPVCNISGVVAKVGQVGLTAERYEALKAMEG